MTDLPEDVQRKIRELTEALREKLVEIARRKPPAFSLGVEFHGANGMVRVTKWRPEEREQNRTRKPNP